MLYPSMTPSRFVSDLSGIWDFAFDNGKGMEEKWYEKPLAEPLSMPVPSSYNDLTESITNREHYGWDEYPGWRGRDACVCGQERCSPF